MAERSFGSGSMADLERGLSSEEVKRRIIEYGYNEVQERRASLAARFLGKFWGLSPWMLEATAVLEWFLGKYLEMFVVTILLFFNAVLSFAQERKSDSALDVLRQKLRVNARVRRNGKWITVPAKELVPGDILRLRAGDFVPADVRLVEGIAEVDQSAMTGESLPVERKAGEELYSGSIMRKGEITAVVAATGAKTYFGRTVELVQVAKPKLHVEEAISKVSRWLLAMTLAMLSIGLVLAVIYNTKLSEMVPLTAILLLSAIPVALPTMFTITMALGSLELAKKGVLITRLDASEDAAAMDIVCVDKTGTMTMNKLSIRELVPIGEHEERDVVLYGAIASQEANLDPIDQAFFAAAEGMRLSLEGYKQKRFVPFDPSTRRTEATVEKEGLEFHVLKGSFQTVKSICVNEKEELKKAEGAVEELSKRGYRIIAVAKGETQENLKLAGIAALYDAPRTDSSSLISELKQLGISVKMLTGDALPIAKEVSKQLGLGGNLIRISGLKDSAGEEERLRIMEECNGFAEIFPEDKFLIVKSLQEGKHVVGMTGDVVNDAPALRQAEVGIAVANATDVAKKASSAVLTTEGLVGIVDLVKTGRMIFQRIASWVINKMIRTFKRVVFIVVAFVLTGRYVVSTFDMILLLFLSDYVTLSLSTDRVRYSKKPESWDITGLVKTGIVLGILMVFESLGILYIGLSYFGLLERIDQLHTFVFNFLTFSGYFTVLAVRERRHFWESRPSRALAFAIATNMAIVSLISIIGIPGVAPIDPGKLLAVVSYSFATFLLNDLVKVFLVRRIGAAL
ncbi:MAG: plasma-membrane proton-efflux P-type ATPase [Candidatus Brockarchaeota archaeon]|nr:plasma-membrane proton-efflux P-type ATPase [Candidatus Brockarchaeota archaeon]